MADQLVKPSRNRWCLPDSLTVPFATISRPCGSWVFLLQISYIRHTRNQWALKERLTV